MKKKVSYKIPSIKDPRWVQATVLCLYAISARELFHFERDHWVTLSCLLVSMALDALIGYIKYNSIFFPLSPIIIALSTSLLIDARTPYPYLFIAALATLSKAFITYKERHFFNPSNLGVVFALQLLPTYVTGMPTLFSGLYLPSVFFFILGMFTAFYAKQIDTVISWLLAFLAFGVVRSYMAGSSLILALAPSLGPAFLLFTFHMITDPSTTPATQKYRIFFSVGVALLDAVFRYQQIPYGTFYALFILSTLTPWIRDQEKQLNVVR
jgi:enediyne biosynthesis protein E5